MKRYIIPFLLAAVIFNGCTKDDNWMPAEEILEIGAKRLFQESVVEAVNILQFCELFQEYLDASEEDRIQDKYKEIRESVSQKSDRYFKVSGYRPLSGYSSLSADFTTNGTSINSAGGIIDFEEGAVIVRCIDDGEWEIKGSIDRWYSDDAINFTVIYKKASSGSVVADMTVNGNATSKGKSTEGYTAEFSSGGSLSYLGSESYIGIFRMTTFNDKGSKLDEYFLRLSGI